MDNVNQTEYEAHRLKVLEEKWYTDEMLTAFRRNINKKVKPVEALVLGKKLLELISTKGYSDLDKDGKVAEVTKLIFAGANLEAEAEKTGDTCLIVCAKKNYYITFNLLVRAGAFINAQNNFMSTAAMWSARKGHKEILEDLILLNADINMRCQDGDTALHSAVRHNQIESVRLLIQSGVILNAQNNLGQDVLNIAWSKGHNEVAKIISTYLSKQPTQFVKCTEEEVREELRQARERLKALLPPGYTYTEEFESQTISAEEVAKKKK